MPELPEPINHTVEAIYRSYEDRPHDSERTYLGMSWLGEECERAIWYKWRNACEPERLDGRKLRLFDTGHREEVRLIADLYAAGIDVQETDPATGEQWALSAVGGHVKGHMDALATGVPEAPKTLHVVECKTHNEKSFKALVKNGVQNAKPVHYAQMQLYMHHVGADRALYIAVNKNDDSLHVERVHYDAVTAMRLMARAERVIKSDIAPPKLHNDPTSRAAFACAWCPALAQCHEGQFARMNCRTCIHSTAVTTGDAVWRCERHNKDLTGDEQKAGCGDHRFLPSLVPGEQIDVEGDVIVYRLADGNEWRDGAGRAVA